MKRIFSIVAVYFFPGVIFLYGLQVVFARQILFPEALGLFPVFGYSAMYCGAALMLIGTYFHIHAREVFFNTGYYMRDTAYLLWLAALLLVIGIIGIT